MKKYMFSYLFLLSLLFAPDCFTSKNVTSLNNHNTIKADRFSATIYEKNILNYLNELRRNPSGFYHKYINTYIQKNPKKFTPYYTNSLKKTLLKQPPLPLFKTSKELNSFAKKQLHYLTSTLKGQRLTHNQGSLTFSKRAENIKISCIAENLYRASYNDPLAVVLDLLIDQGISSLGHRKNILNPEYTLINIQSAVAPNNFIVTVMDFSCQQ